MRQVGIAIVTLAILLAAMPVWVRAQEAGTQRLYGGNSILLAFSERPLWAAEQQPGSASKAEEQVVPRFLVSATDHDLVRAVYPSAELRTGIVRREEGSTYRATVLDRFSSDNGRTVAVIGVCSVDGSTLEPESFHANSTTVSILVLGAETPRGHEILCLDREITEGGGFGSPPDCSLLPVGPERVTIMVKSGWAGQGFYSDTTQLYTLCEKKMCPALSVTSQYSDNDEQAASHEILIVDPLKLQVQEMETTGATRVTRYTWATDSLKWVAVIETRR